MRKIIFADYMEFNDKYNKLGNYHYARCFAENGYEVLWMSCLYNKLLYFKHKDVYKQRKLLSTEERHMLDENIFGFAVKSRRLYGKYPFCNDANIALHNEKYIAGDIKEKFKKINFLEVDILWISNPKQFWLINVINYKKLVFRIPDDFTEFGVFPKGIEKIESEIIKKSDIIFVTAENLKYKAERYNKKAILLPNGCEINHFLKSSNEKPKEYIDDNKKKIIYVGAISKWFNVELIQELAVNVDANMYIIGRCDIDLSKLKKYSNIKVLGPKGYAEIPKYIKNSDVAIIPFINNNFTDRINPIKLFEYLACGVPVVTTNMKEVVRLKSPALTSINNKEFINNIKKIINTANSDKNKYIDFAIRNSWTERTKEAEKYILK